MIAYWILHFYGDSIIAILLQSVALLLFYLGIPVDDTESDAVTGENDTSELCMQPHNLT